MDSILTRGGLNIDTFMAASVTYSATASATNVWVISGSATRLVRVQRIVFSGVKTASGVVSTIALTKHSVANTGGTAASVTCVAVDSSQAIAATAVVKNYTANPTVDGTEKILWQPAVIVPITTAVGGPAVIFDVDFSLLLNGKMPTLRGVAEEIGISLLGTVPSGLVGLQVSCIFTEEKK